MAGYTKHRRACIAGILETKAEVKLAFAKLLCFCYRVAASFPTHPVLRADRKLTAHPLHRSRNTAKRLLIRLGQTADYSSTLSCRRNTYRL